MSIVDDLSAQIAKLKLTPEKVHTIHDKIRRLTNTFDTPGPDMRDVQDFKVSHDDFPVGVRLYVPKQASSGPGPCLIYLHGGGFVTCSLESHEGLCLRVADTANIRVLSVDYRLAPQHPFPCGPDDCEHVLNWALSGGGIEYGIDPSLIGVGGDSAGGNMTAYLCQKYRQDVRAQILYYPLMQMARLKPIHPGPQDVFQLGVVALSFIMKHYVVDADVQDVRVSPLFEDNLQGLPPTKILTCGLDPLREEGLAYRDKLERSGVPVHYVHEKALPHGFLNFARAFPKAKTIPVETGEFLRQHLISRLG